jgi:hypothetical protein
LPQTALSIGAEGGRIQATFEHCHIRKFSRQAMALEYLLNDWKVGFLATQVSRHRIVLVCAVRFDVTANTFDEIVWGEGLTGTESRLDAIEHPLQ